MNIVIFTDTYYPETNGIAVTTKTLVDVLKNNGHQVLVVTSTYNNKIPSNENNIYYISFPKKKKRSLFTTISVFNNLIFRHVKAFKPDLVHNQTNGQIGQLGRYTADKLKIPFIYTYHSHFEEYAPYVEPGMINRIARARERTYLKKMMNISTEFIAPSSKIKNYLRKKGVDKYINVITTGIDINKWDNDEAVKKDIKYLHKKYEIPDETKVLMYVGAISEEKNLDLLIKSYKKYLDSEPKTDTRLVIVGEGDQQSALESLVAQLDIKDNVIFAGKVNHDKMKSYFAFADLFVTASTSETQSVSTMEAMAANCLVLVKDDETLVDLIDRDKNGFIFNSDDSFVEELNRLFSLSEDEKEKVRKAARKTIVTNYSLEKYYEKIVEVYERAKRKKW